LSDAKFHGVTLLFRCKSKSEVSFFKEIIILFFMFYNIFLINILHISLLYGKHHGFHPDGARFRFVSLLTSQAIPALRIRKLATQNETGIFGHSTAILLYRALLPRSFFLSNFASIARRQRRGGPQPSTPHPFL